MTDHRDQAIERLLRTGHRDVGDDLPAGCVQPDVLAAWAEGSLRPAERASAERHAADCVRCQAMLAAMARTAPEPIARPVGWSMIPRPRWLIPLTGAAAAAVLWFAIAPRPPSSSLASAPEPAAVVLAPPAGARDAPAEPPARHAPARAREQDRASALREQVAAEPQPPPASVGGLAKDEARADRRAENAQTADARERDRSALPAAPLAAAAPRALAEAPAAVTAKAMSDSAGAAMARSVTFVPLEVRSPDPVFRWRARTDAAIDYSSDGGSTWQRQATGAAGMLAAASAPAPTVCWFVGQSGLVLVTTDGLIWRRAASPDASTLASVIALDARRATVTTADGRQFSTTDGGSTWSRLPLQEFPAAAF